MMRNTFFFPIFLMAILTGCKKDNPETIPLSPTELTAIVASESQILLSWKDNSQNESGFNIERKTGAGTYAKIVSLPAGTTKYSDAGLQNYTNYSYRVNAFNAVGPSSTYTNEASATTGGVPILTTAPIADTSSETASSGGIVTNDGGSPVTARGVVWNTSPAPTVDLLTKTIDGTGTGTFTSQIKGLLEQTKYYVRAYATNTTGTGYGEEISFVAPSPDIYLAGFINPGFRPIATYWKNGVPFKLTDGSVAVTANAVFVSGNDVFVAGNWTPSADTRVMLWVNGINTMITSRSSANAIYALGGNSYIAGWQLENNKQSATIWKNGLPTTLTSTPGISYNLASAVFVSGQDVYAAGSENLNGINQALVWKNNGLTVLSDGVNPAGATSIFVDNTDVYVAGNIVYNKKARAVYWKNGQPVELTDGTESALANSIFIYNHDVYVGGSQIVNGKLQARVWKNGVLTSIADTAPHGGSVQSIYVLGGNVYVAGIKSNGLISWPTVWKNHEVIWTAEPCGCGTVGINSIFVAK